MRALDPTPGLGGTPPRVAQLAEALMSAATELATVSDPTVFARPTGVPVRSGRLHLARVRHWLPLRGPVTVVVGFATAAWLGSPDERVPALGQLTYRCETSVDRRGRVVLDRQARAWFAVADPSSFEAIVMPVSTGGILVVPVEDYARRFGTVTP